MARHIQNWETNDFAGFKHIISLKQHNLGNHNYKIRNRSRGVVIQHVRTIVPEGSNIKIGVYGYEIYPNMKLAIEGFNHTETIPSKCEFNTK